MSKLTKAVIIFGYTFLFFQYLKITLKPTIVEIDINYLIRTTANIKKQEKLSKVYAKNFSLFIKSFKKPKRFKTDLKFILKFTTAFLHYNTPLYKNGQKPFIESNCTYYNCFLTSDASLMNDYRDFDAILFDVENSWDGPIVIRAPYQKFVFMASESAANYPLCDAFYDYFFNLTWTYRLDSDIRWSYLSIVDRKGNFVGPKCNMTWVEDMKSTPLKVKKKLGGKTKAAAWFVSNCNALSGRQNITRSLEAALWRYNLTVDTYGWCGKKKCPKDRLEECLDLLRADYFFYLSFENSLSDDYVTEKVLYPLQNYAVPIVYGGADYSKFLPPGSYLNAGKLDATQLADKMYEAIKNPAVYENYFRWHNYYKYEKHPPEPDLCRLCKILNEQADTHTVYKQFRYWWNPDYMQLCRAGIGRFLVMKPDVQGVLEAVENHDDKKRRIVKDSEDSIMI